jgi:hypothetical protein
MDLVLDISDVKITWFETFFNKKDYKKIGFKSSAGLDSSLLLYILSYFITKTETFDKVIYPYHGWDKSQTDLDSPSVIKNIISFIRSQFPKVDIRDPYILEFYSYDKFGNNIRSNHSKGIFGKDTGCPFPKEAEKYLLEKYDIDIFLNGRNCNLTRKETEKLGIISTYDEQRDPRRDRENILTAFDKMHGYFAETTAIENSPWYNVNKFGIRELYEKFELMETLAPMTISCTHIGPPYPCGKCHWCKEKQSIFGFL